MADETSTEAIETEEAPELMSFIGEKGELKEGWKNAFLPEDMRHKPVYNKFLDLKGALTQVGIQDELVGRKGVLIPGENATATEWENFYQAAGRPATKDDYKLPVPDDIKDHYDPNLISIAKDLFHKAGFNQKQAEALWHFEEDRLRQSIKAIEDAEKAEHEQCVESLKRNWGDAYDERTLLANKILEDNTTDELKQNIVAKYGNDPVITELLYNVGRKFVDHKVIASPGQAAGGAMTPGEANSKMKELIATPGYVTGEMRYENPAAYERITKEVARLAAVVSTADADTR